MPVYLGLCFCGVLILVNNVHLAKGAHLLLAVHRCYLTSILISSVVFFGAALVDDVVLVIYGLT